MTQTARPSPPAPPPQFAFGPFQLDLANALLLRDGRPVALTPKALEVLHHLASRPQRLVTKDELLDAVWPDVLVSDASIKVCVREIRKALDDDVRTPRYIETVHRRGYRFIATVRKGKSGPEPGDVSATDLEQVTAPALGVTAPRNAIVGRYDELRRLASAFTRALSGRTQCVFITGGAGSGKTTLVDAFSELVHSRAWKGAREPPMVLSGHCFERFGTSEPYMPVWEALGRLARKRPSPQLHALLERHAAAYVAPAPQPEGVARTVTGVLAVEPRSMNDRLLREIAETIEQLAAVDSGVPLLLVIEDLHWADYSTLDLLTALARRRAPAQLMIIATYRPTEVLAAEHPLGGIVQWLLSGDSCMEVALQFLDEAAVAQYLAARFPGSRLPEALAGKLHQRTGGHPLFLVNLVNDLLAQGVLQLEGGARHAAGADGIGEAPAVSEGPASSWASMLETHVPKTVRAMIQTQLDRLERDERQVLEAAAVAGVEFSASAAAAAMGDQDVVRVEQICDELDRRGRFLEARGLAEWPDGSAATRYRFVHELYHNVVYGQIPVARRVSLHAALGAKLEAAWGARVTEGAAELASHFEAARDWTRAVRYLRQAAEVASRHYAHREAVHYLRRALGALERLRPDQRLQHELAVLMALGVNLQVTSGFAAPEVQQVHARAQALCSTDGGNPLGDARECFPVLWGIWLFHKVRSDLVQAEEMARQLLTMAQRTGKSALLLQAQQAMSVTNLCLGNPAETVRQMQQAEAIYDPAHHSGNTEYYGQDPGVATLAFGAVALQIMDRQAQASAACQRALELARRLDQPSTTALAMHFAAMLHQLRGDAPLTQRWAQATIDLATGEGFSFWRAGGIVLRGWARVTGDGKGPAADAGVAEIRAGLDDWLATGSRTYQTYYLGLLADALLRLDRPAEALPALEQALEAARSLPEGLYEAELHRLRGQALARMSKSDAARECFEQAVAIALRQGAKAFEARAAAELNRREAP